MTDLSHLNLAQRSAVEHVSGPMLVLAGAGSGKTRVITQRIVHLMGKGVPPESIAAMTFTNKAAEEMRERVAGLLGSKRVAGRLTMGTFHSLGLQILRSERKTLGFGRGFVIYDTADQMGLVRELLRRIDVSGRKFDPKAILTRISLAKNSFIAPEDYDPNESDEYDEITGEIYPKYEQALNAFAAVDFDDLIVKPVKLFQEHEHVAEKWKGKFLHVMVDEFQDTNRSQMMLIRLLVERHNNLCVVGDDDQSIYSWRGADPSHILGFEKRFPGAKVVMLEQNYRSTPNILEAANEVIAHNTDRYGKELWSDKYPGSAIVHAVALDPEAEAKFVAQEIRSHRESSAWRYGDVAILYRSNLQSAAIEEELRLADVPYIMYGGQQFFERKEVKDIIAYFRAALNQRDEISLRRVINYPARGIGPTTLTKLAAFSEEHHTTLWNAVTRASDVDLRPAAWRGVMGFYELMTELRERLEAGNDFAGTVQFLIDATDLYADLRSGSSSVKVAGRRIENVEAFKRTLKRHQERGEGTKGLEDFLRHLSLNSDDGEREDVGNRVVLTTLHGSKGLEFPVVFMVGTEEMLLPHARTLMPIATDVLDTDHAVDVSEERRLAYVGMTRAMRELYMCRAKYRRMRGKALPRTPSRFLLEVPEELTVMRDVASEAEEMAPQDEVKSFFSNFDFD